MKRLLILLLTLTSSVGFTQEEFIADPAPGAYLLPPIGGGTVVGFNGYWFATEAFNPAVIGLHYNRATLVGRANGGSDLYASFSKGLGHAYPGAHRLGYRHTFGGLTSQSFNNGWNTTSAAVQYAHLTGIKGHSLLFGVTAGADIRTGYSATLPYPPPRHTQVRPRLDVGMWYVSRNQKHEFGLSGTNVIPQNYDEFGLEVNPNLWAMYSYQFPIGKSLRIYPNVLANLASRDVRLNVIAMFKNKVYAGIGHSINRRSQATIGLRVKSWNFGYLIAENGYRYSHGLNIARRLTLRKGDEPNEGDKQSFF